jgi:spore coat protein H
MKKILFSFPLGVLVLSALLGSPAISLGDPGAKNASKHSLSPSDDDLFDEVKVIKLKIQIAKPALKALEDAPYSYVAAQLEEGDRVYPNVGLRLKGARTFRPVDKKPNFSIKLNEYMPQQLFHGLRRILLNNAIEEKTYVQEFLGQELFRAAGTPTPRVNYARVELNGRDLGLYVLVEGITRDFLERHFGEGKGNLYEGVEADIDGELEQDYGKRSRRQDLVPLINAAREKDPVKRREQLGQVLNMDQFLSYIALENAINVWDGYSLRLNNYRIYADHVTGRVTFIPHGLDNFFVVSDYPLLPEFKGSVANAMTDTSEDRKRYFQRMNELCSTVLKKENLQRRIDELAAKIRPVLTELGQAKSHERAIAAYHKRIDRRFEYIAEQLPIELAGGKGKKKPKK